MRKRDNEPISTQDCLDLEKERGGRREMFSRDEAEEEWDLGSRDRSLAPTAGGGRVFAVQLFEDIGNIERLNSKFRGNA